MITLWQGKARGRGTASLLPVEVQGCTYYSSMKVGVLGLHRVPSDPAMGVASFPLGNSGSPNFLLELSLTQPSRERRGALILPSGVEVQVPTWSPIIPLELAGMRVPASCLAFSDSTPVEVGGLITTL